MRPPANERVAGGAARRHRRPAVLCRDRVRDRAAPGRAPLRCSLTAGEFARNHEFAPVIPAAEKPTCLDMMQASDQGIGGVRELAECFALKSTARTRSAIARAREVLRGGGVERKANGRGRVKRKGRQVYTGPGGGGDGDGEELRRAANAGDARAQAIVDADLLGEDGEEARAEGREWVERAARGGDARGAVMAGDACRAGAGGPRDLEAAVA